jgi:F-type H+-transporting ATPase subunit b
MTQRSWSTVGRLACAALLLLLASGVALAATPAAGEHAQPGLINVDVSLIVQIFNFLVLLVLLHWLLYRPFLAKMEERTEAIRKSLDEAQAARAEAARQQEENAARLRAAHQEAARIREQALREAAEVSRKQLEAAQGQARRLVEEARAQLEAEVRAARAALRREVADLATAAAEKLVRRTLRDDDHRRIVADAVARLGN